MKPSRSWKFGSGNILKSINVKNVVLPIDKVNKVCYIMKKEFFYPIANEKGGVGYV